MIEGYDRGPIRKSALQFEAEHFVKDTQCRFSRYPIGSVGYDS
jgi:hypothetical protein